MCCMVTTQFPNSLPGDKWADYTHIIDTRLSVRVHLLYRKPSYRSVKAPCSYIRKPGIFGTCFRREGLPQSLTTPNNMAVMTALQKTESKGQDIITKKHVKSHYKTRPITATLDHPLILDIKLLKKLDMTTFTKKGLIALSKFCGISLINKTETKKKLNKCVKTIQYAKKQVGSEGNELSVTTECGKNYRTKRKFGKQAGKAKPRIRFKISREETVPDEDSLDVICKKHNKVLKPCNQMTGSGVDGKPEDRKSVIDSILKGTKENVIPEPCKTCNRSEHPERFHSHPKALMRLSLERETHEKNMEERFRSTLTTKHEKEMKKSACAKDSEARSHQDAHAEQLHTNTSESNSSKSSSKSPSISSIGSSSPETGKKSKAFRKPQTPSSSSTKSKIEALKKTNSKVEVNQKDESKTGEEDMKFVTGCYVCGKPVSPKLRIKHEKTCIEEWRTQNRLISPDKRKPEPKRPDYRFTGSGDLDYEGTFESIWANHMDSLVPCKKCGRKFFPDRIERHENCCNNLPINIKYKH